MSKKIPIVHHSGGSGQFNVYTSMSLLNLVKGEHKDGYEAVALIGNRIVPVTFDIALRAYVTTTRRIQMMKPHPLPLSSSAA